MKRCEPIFLGRTFDDFLLLPQYSRLASREDRERNMLKMPLTRHLSLSWPIIAANMDTVTGEKMMKTVSLEGAFAFLPRSNSIGGQVAMVNWVKRQHSFIVETPAKIHQQATIEEAKRLADANRTSCLLVESEPGSNVLAGILSKRDLRAGLCDGPGKKVDRFMSKFPELHTAPLEITMEEAERLMNRLRIEKLPLIKRNRRIVGLITMKDIEIAKQKPYSSKDQKGRLLVGAAIGATGDYLERAAELIRHGTDCILIDVAHFHSISGKTATREFRHKFPDVELVGGNIATAQAARDVLAWGVDAVKVGVGPGKGCRTRLETGFGVPQLQAIREVYLAIGKEVPIMADGGMKHDKDVFLAIAAGASTVMLGSMLAGTDESPGIVIKNPKTKQPVKIYRGMTSPQALIDQIRDEKDLAEALRTPAEGQPDEIPYVGSVVDVLERIAGHLRSAVSYSGFKTLQEAHDRISRNAGKYFSSWLSPAAQRESFDR